MSTSFQVNIRFRQLNLNLCNSWVDPTGKPTSLDYNEIRFIVLQDGFV